MSDKDYEKYVLSDVVHVGWKGWAHMNQHIVQHMKDDKTSITKIITNNMNTNTIKAPTRRV